ncbi:MAG: SPOR domain-containing protein [Candidatus Kapabacteria bacterium]|jgi:hypothetical protein|nr:SPOR domain-containing protein [Candidatus Kapabacteria bacterium]
MIEIDDTNHDDFLSDADKSGFDDDQESFRLGKFPDASATPSVAASALPKTSLSFEADESATDKSLAKPIESGFAPKDEEEPLFPSRLARTELAGQTSLPSASEESLSRFSQETVTEHDLDDDGPSFDEISRELASAFAPSSSTEHLENRSSNASIDELSTAAAMANAVDLQSDFGSKAATEAVTESAMESISEAASAHDFRDETPFQTGAETLAEYVPETTAEAAPILDRDALLEKRYQEQLRQEQEDFEAYLRGDLTGIDAAHAEQATHNEPEQAPQHLHSGEPQTHEHSTQAAQYADEAPLKDDNNTISAQGVSAEPRTVITIPDADEQRRRDAEYAANQKAKQSQSRSKPRSRGLVAASVFGLGVTAAVALGYLVMRKTTVGTSIGGVWSKISGQTSSQVLNQDTSIAPLDLTQNSAQHSPFSPSSDEAGKPSASISDSALPQTPSPQNPETTPNASAQAMSQISDQSSSNKTDSQAAQNQSLSNQSAQTIAANTPQPNNTTKENVSSKTTDTKVSSSQSKGEQVSEQKSPKVSPALALNATKQQEQPQKKTEQPKEQSKEQPKEQTKTEQPSPKQPNNQAPSNQATKPQTTKQPSNQPTTKQARSSAVERQSTQQINGVFAIQVYATPSLEDAEEWLERLKQRGMLNPIITSQVIRGQTIYRVRFGLYNTLQAAEKDAGQFGFAGAWVVRLR